MASDVSGELRTEVASRAAGRCEYCLLHEDDAHFRRQIDHAVSRKSIPAVTSGPIISGYVAR